MKVIDRVFNPRGGVGKSYKPLWSLYLECGHTRTLCANSPSYYRGELIKHLRCDVCDKPVKRKLQITSDAKLEKFADYIIDNDL